MVFNSHFKIVEFDIKRDYKKAVSYNGDSSTVGDRVLFECKAFTIDYSSMLRTIQ